MKSVVVAFGLLLWSASAASPALTSSDLKDVGVTPPPGARVPIETRWTDESGTPISLEQAMAGRPAILIFADYTCTTLCGPILSFVEKALATSQLASRDYRLVVLGIDPKDGPREATAMRREQVASSSAGDPVRNSLDALVVRIIGGVDQ